LHQRVRMNKRTPILTAPAFLLRFRRFVLSRVPDLAWADLRIFFDARVSVRSGRVLRPFRESTRETEKFEVADL
jgi:hypothetical protein